MLNDKNLVFSLRFGTRKARISTDIQHSLEDSKRNYTNKRKKEKIRRKEGSQIKKWENDGLILL